MEFGKGAYHTVTNISGDEMDSYFAILDKRIAKSSEEYLYIKYLTLGKIIVKIENRAPELTPYIETQWSYCLSDEEKPYDCTFHVWKDDLKSLLIDNVKDVSIAIFPKKDDASFITLDNNVSSAYNAKTKRLYYNVGNEFSVDDIRKMGHLFVRLLAKISKVSNQILAHSAAVGINGKGILLSAKGGGGKSTLAVSAMFNGFQYVSDDYCILSKSEHGLCAYPIYSTINLTPQMQEKMSGLKANYLWDSWWQPHKHTLDISAHHNRFVRELPLKAIVFPRIADVAEPTIEQMKEKDRAIIQLVHSTVTQLTNANTRADYIRQLMSFVSGLDVYQINLSPDLDKNVKVLRQFIETL